jgi:hypothetical protein
MPARPREDTPRGAPIALFFRFTAKEGIPVTLLGACCDGKQNENQRSSDSLPSPQTPLLRTGMSDSNVRDCILVLSSKRATSPERFGHREPGTSSPRLSRRNAELHRRSHAALSNSKMKPYPVPAQLGASSNNSSMSLSRRRFTKPSINNETCNSYTRDRHRKNKFDVSWL